MKSDVATDLIRHVIDSIIDNISNRIVDANINKTNFTIYDEDVHHHQTSIKSQKRSQH